ncbi:hypothetical protein BDR26DRAFT_914566, partial [Obelidium mucronatum]
MTYPNPSISRPRPSTPSAPLTASNASAPTDMTAIEQHPLLRPLSPSMTNNFLSPQALPLFLSSPAAYKLSPFNESVQASTPLLPMVDLGFNFPIIRSSQVNHFPNSPQQILPINIMEHEQALPEKIATMLSSPKELDRALSAQQQAFDLDTRPFQRLEIPLLGMDTTMYQSPTDSSASLALTSITASTPFSYVESCNLAVEQPANFPFSFELSQPYFPRLTPDASPITATPPLSFLNTQPHLTNPRLIARNVVPLSSIPKITANRSSPGTSPLPFSRVTSPKLAGSRDRNSSADDDIFDEDLPDPNDPDAKRFRLPKKQMDWLKRRYEETPHPTQEELMAFSSKIGMNKRKLRIWFQNRR